MAERDREGGCRRRGVVFSIPPRNGGAASVAAEGIAQQIKISTAHQGLPVLHEPDRSIAEVMSFPPARWHAALSEQGCGNGTIARPVLTGVKRAQGLDQAIATLGRKRAEMRARRMAGKGAPQAPGRVGAEFEKGIDRQGRSICSAGNRGFMQEKPVLNAVHTQEDIPAAGHATNVRRWKFIEADIQECRPALFPRARQGDNRR